MSFSVLPIPTALAEVARRTRRAPGYGHAVEGSLAPPGGYGRVERALRFLAEQQATQSDLGPCGLNFLLEDGEAGALARLWARWPCASRRPCCASRWGAP